MKFIYFIAFQLVLLLTVVLVNRKYLNSKLSNLKIAFLSSTFFYIILLIVVLCTNYILRKELDSYDLNGDGTFSIEEQTVVQQQSMTALITDVGRNLAPIVGIIYSAIYFIIIIIPLSIFNKSKIK